jgi:hypothetical protein
MMKNPEKFGKSEADVHSLDVVSEDHAKGLSAIGNHILTKYPKGNYLYVGIGRSPVLVVEYLQQKGGQIVELPIGKIRYLNDADKEDPPHEVAEYVQRTIGPVNKPGILIIDFAGSGASLNFIRKILQSAYYGRAIVNFSLASSDLQDDMEDNVDDQQMSHAQSFSERMTPEIGKAIHAAFDSIDVRTIDGRTEPVPKPDAKVRRSLLVQEIIRRFG